jgi:hypothetical protein
MSESEASPTTRSPGELLTPTELAQRWGCSKGHLANLRSSGSGPDYVKLSREQSCEQAFVTVEREVDTAHDFDTGDAPSDPPGQPLAPRRSSNRHRNRDAFAPQIQH